MDKPKRAQADLIEPKAALYFYVERANRAYLTMDKNGRPSLYLRGLLYEVDDFLPNLSIGRRSLIKITAGEFVCRQMHRDFGHDETRWPALARQFLTMHAPRLSGKSHSAQQRLTAAS
jgi:hypothetical protein